MTKDSFHAVAARLLGEQLQELLDHVQQSAEFSKPQQAELVRLLGAMIALQAQHRVNGRGRCRVCWTTRRWSRRQQCSVHAALTFYLIQPEVGIAEVSPRTRTRVVLH